MSPKQESLIAWLLLPVCLAALAYLGFLWFERLSLYGPIAAHDAPPSGTGIPYEDVTLTAADGVRLHAWFIPAPAGAARPMTLLFSHGNAGNISHRMEKIRIFRDLGANVFIYDYRGYGKSEGRPSEKGMVRDAEAAWRHLVEARAIPAERIVSYGESLGAAVALELALRRDVAGVILDSPFTSVVDMAKILFPILPARLLVRNRYDSLAKIRRLDVPVLVLHSREDEIIPFAMAERLHAAAPDPKTLVELTGDYNADFLITGPRYGEAMGAFVEGLKRSAE